MIQVTTLASGSSGNCYHVTDGSTPLLLDCGIAYKEIQRGLNYKVTGLAGVLVTHEHKDHCKALSEISSKAGIDCYMSRGTADAIGVSVHRIKTVRAKEQFALGTWTILPFDVQHDCAEPLGFLLASKNGGKVLYLTDTAYCKYKFTGLTHILIETNYSMDILRENVANGTIPLELKNRIIRTHMSLHTAKEFLRANDLSRVEEIHLLHLSGDNSDADRFKREVQALTGRLTFVH